MAYIDKNKLAEMIRAKADTLIEGKEAFFCVANWIDKLPDANIVKVVRCKNCQQHNTNSCADGFGWCEHFNVGTADEHFCSYGTPKERGGEND